MTRWTTETAAEALAMWMAREARQPTFAEWQRMGSSFPSRATLQNLFGSWSAAIAAAGGTPLGRGQRLPEVAAA